MLSLIQRIFLIKSMKWRIIMKYDGLPLRCYMTMIVCISLLESWIHSQNFISLRFPQTSCWIIIIIHKLMIRNKSVHYEWYCCYRCKGKWEREMQTGRIIEIIQYRVQVQLSNNQKHHYFIICIALRALIQFYAFSYISSVLHIFSYTAFVMSNFVAF